MTTVSLHECRGSVSLRSCGSSNKSLFENRRRLQCCSPEKSVRRTPTPQTSVPDIRGISLSPADSPAGVPPSPVRSPVKWNHGYRSDDFSGSLSSSDEFSDEDLGEICGSQEVSRILSHHQYADLRIIGSKPKICSTFEMPEIKSTSPKLPFINSVNQTPTAEKSISDLELELDLGRQCTSPENPPPSPINYRPTLDGFVVGGKKITCQEKKNFRLTYNVRDFTPGLVKHPLHHCSKCEGRMTEEEQSQVALDRRKNEFFRSQASPFRWESCMILSRLSYKTQVDSISHLIECEHDARSFVEIYKEKKTEKEEREKEREAVKHELKLKEKQKRYEPEHSPIRTSDEDKQISETQVSEKPSSNTSTGSTSTGCKLNEETKENFTTRQFIRSVRKFSRSRLPPISGLKPDRFLIGNITDLSVVKTIQGKDSEKDVKPKLPVENVNRPVALEKCQVRRCWSDIWPFRDSPDTKKLQADFEAMEEVRPKSSRVDNRQRGESISRITPFCPLSPCLSSSKNTTEISKSTESRVLSPDLMISSTDVNAEVNEIQDESSEELSDDEAANTPNITLTATVIVPPIEKSCSQWITFNADHEPVLNNAPTTEGGCDNFLKRLQRVKLFPNEDLPASLPTGQQFCFEPITDKRYNRWKRRRRKKKDTECRRSTIPIDSESSDEEINEREMERIIGHMYEEIHGPVPATPNGTTDTPRMRNRRRRKHLTSRSETKLADSAIDSFDLHYDASSEWMTSDRSDDDLVYENKFQRTVRKAFSAGCQRQFTDSAITDIRNENPVPADEAAMKLHPPADEYKVETTENEEHSILENGRNISCMDDMCSWPYLDQYREELMERIKSSSTDDVLNDDWLPEIPSSTSPVSNRVDHKSYGNDKSHVDNKSNVDNKSIADNIADADNKHNAENKVYADSKSYTHSSMDLDQKPIELEQSTSDPTPINRDPIIKMRERSQSFSSEVQEKRKAKGRIPLTMPSITESKKYGKFMRKPQQLVKLKTKDEKPKMVSRLAPYGWSELGVNLRRPKHIGVTSSGVRPELELSTSSFTASSIALGTKNLPQPKETSTKADLKENKISRNKEFNLPKLNKPLRTTPSSHKRNSLLNAEKKLKKVVKTEPEQPKRSKTTSQPKQLAQKIPNNIDIDMQPQFLFRDYYLRKLHGKKMQLNSDMKSVSTSSQVKQTITVDRLDVHNRKSAQKLPHGEERNLSNLSFTRAFTYSMFDLPDVQRMYNRRLERKAELANYL